MTLEEALRQGRVNLGDHVNYPVAIQTISFDEQQTGWGEVQTFTTEVLEWVLEKNKEELILIPTEATVARLTLKGKTGYDNGPDTLNTLCEGGYTNSNLAKRVISMNRDVYDGLLPKYKKTAIWYWLSDQWDNGCYFGLQVVSSSGGYDDYLCFSYSNIGSGTYAVCPTVYLKSNLHLTVIEDGRGTKENPWDFVEAA